MNGRKLLIYYSIINNGDFYKIYDCVLGDRHVSEEEVDRVLSTVKSNVVTMLDPEYPQELKKISPPPLVLFYYGDLSLVSSVEKNIGVVGSRDYSEYGASITESIVKDIAERLNVVSGMAIGIDTIALKTAIENHGKVIAILPSGIDCCYPKRNQALYDLIKKEHLLISEYPNDLEPDPNYCRMRNRIIAALGSSLLVAEAKGNSGTLITINYTLMQGKEIFCVPYRANEGSHCNRLIKEGALMVENGNDILFELGKNTQKS